jgi:hypothetical protein
MLGAIMLSVMVSPRSSGRLNFTGEMGDLCHIHTNQQVFEPTKSVSLVWVWGPVHTVLATIFKMIMFFLSENYFHISYLTSIKKLMMSVLLLRVIMLSALILGVIMLSVMVFPRSSDRLNFTGKIGDLCHLYTNQQAFEPTKAVSLV